MRKDRVIFFILTLFILVFWVSVNAEDIVWQNISRENLNLRTVLVDAHNPRIIYIGSSNGILKTEDGGDSWRNILSIKGQNRSVYFLFFDPLNKNYLYAASAGGLFYSNNQGKSWKKIFQGKNYLENECTVIAVVSNTIYLGTKAGLFVSKDKGRSWYRQAGALGNSNILAIACNPKEPNCIYVACVDGVFKTQDDTESWEKIFVARPVEDGESSNTEEEIDNQDEEQRFSHIRYIAIDPNNLNCLYLATSRGLYKSQDKGKTWESVSSYGLLSREIKFLLISNKSNLYALTKSGVFEYKSERWQELSFGLVTEDVRFLALDNQDNLYVASDKGLFKANLTYFSNDKQENIIALYFGNEPKIDEVQQTAIKYAEVEADKIKEWRKKAKMKAILPKLTVGIDNSKSTNYEIYTSATTRYVYEGPDDNSSGWDVTLSWDLGDLIWNDDQTSIDVRSRLMVQLRGDILDEVTKLYFERIRVKMEIDNLSIEDRRKRFEKELKLQELTASLDALTGGYFSQQIKNAQGT